MRLLTTISALSTIFGTWGKPKPRKNRYYVVDNANKFGNVFYPASPKIENGSVYVCRGYDSRRPLFQHLGEGFSFGQELHGSYKAKEDPEKIGLREITYEEVRRLLKRPSQPRQGLPSP